jgi:hypothetical protein
MSASVGRSAAMTFSSNIAKRRLPIDKACEPGCERKVENAISSLLP